MEESVKSRVMRVIGEVFSEEREKIDSGSKIGTDFAVSSIERMALFVALEDEFGRTIPQEDVEHLTKVEEVIEFIESKTSG